MIHVFPDLADIGIDYRWTGVVGITRDNFPHIGAIGERVFYAIGYGGRGVALTHLLGKYLARRITGDTSSLGAMTEGAFKPRSEESRVGKECVSTCRFRGAPKH